MLATTAMKHDDLHLHLSPSLRQDQVLASLFNKKTPRTKSGRRASLHSTGHSDRSLVEKRSPPSPMKHSQSLRISSGRVEPPPFSPAGKKKTSPGSSRRGSSSTPTPNSNGSSSRRNSTASRRSSTASRRSSTASSRRGSIESISRRGSALSYDAILAALPQAPLGGEESFRRGDDFTSFDMSERSTPCIHPYDQNDMTKLKKKDSSEEFSEPRRPVSMSMIPDFSSVNGDSKDKASPLCISLPITEEATTVFLKAAPQGSDETKAVSVVENIQGETLATWEFSACRSMRILKGPNGKICAYIQHFLVEGQNKYKICSYAPRNEQHQRGHTGLYTWAEVTNAGTFGAKFSMRLRGGSKDRFTTESFAPSLLNWSKRTRGFAMLKNKEACARMTYLASAKALDVPAGVDLCLLICYTAIIDEMVEGRLR